MAAWRDLSKRLDSGLCQDERLRVASIYRTAPLPLWLDDPLTAIQKLARDGEVPVLLANVKGRKLDDTLVLLRLADLERLIRPTREPSAN